MRGWGRIVRCGMLAVGVMGAIALRASADAVTLRPVGEWSRKGVSPLPECAKVSLPPERLPGWSDVCIRLDALMLRVQLRQRAHAAWLELLHETEMLDVPQQETFALEWQGRTYAFDRFGRLVIDRSFADVEDMELIQRVEALYKTLLAHSDYAKIEVAKPQKLPHAAVQSVPIFAGFEDERYQLHDALILKLVKEFNADRATWAGAAPEMRVDIPELSPALIKSMMLEESGGNGPRSREAWMCDPLQVNVPGDWDEAKADLGLKRPKERNEGTLENNLRAGIMYLVRKGFGVSGKPIAHRSGIYFDSWRTALKRYNGRNDPLHDGRSYRAAYADRILRRAKTPDRFVPIAR